MVAHAKHALALVDGLSLLKDKGIQSLQRGYSLSGEIDVGNGAVFVGGELLYAGGALITTTIGQFAVVIEHIMMPFELHTAAVNGETVLSLIQNLSLICPRTSSLVGSGVGPMFWHTTSSILQIVLAVALVKP